MANSNLHGPQDPARNPDRSRVVDLNENRQDTDGRWAKGWLVAYQWTFIVLGSMWATNLLLGWNGMIINLIIFVLLSMWLLPVITAPTITGSALLGDLIARFIPGVDPHLLRTYFSQVMPEIQFWILLAAGAMAAFPWHLGAWWAIIPVIAGSWFLVVHWWKYKYETKFVQTLSRFYAVSVIVVGIAFALGLGQAIDRAFSWTSMPDPYDENTGAALYVYNPVTGKAFPELTTAICKARPQGKCFDPATGTELKPFGSGNPAQKFGPKPAAAPIVVPAASAVPVSTKPTLYDSVEMPLCDGDKVWSKEVAHPPLGTLYPRWNSNGFRTRIHDGLQWKEVDISGGLTGHTVTKLSFCVRKQFRMSAGGTMHIYQK